jgi:hypothetical protein
VNIKMTNCFAPLAPTTPKFEHCSASGRSSTNADQNASGHIPLLARSYASSRSPATFLRRRAMRVLFGCLLLCGGATLYAQDALYATSRNTGANGPLLWKISPNNGNFLQEISLSLPNSWGWGGISALAFGNGELYATSRNTGANGPLLWKINPNNGTFLQEISLNLPNSWGWGGIGALAFGNGELYATSRNTGASGPLLWKINPNNGTFLQEMSLNLPNSWGWSGIGALAFGNGELYATSRNTGASGPLLWKINPNNGNFLQEMSLTLPNSWGWGGVGALTFGNGELYATSSNTGASGPLLWKINPNNGAFLQEMSLNLPNSWGWGGVGALVCLAP